MDRKSQADDDEDDTRHRNTVLLVIEFLVHHFLIKSLLMPDPSAWIKLFLSGQNIWF